MRHPRIALWGAFDVEDCSRLPTPRGGEAELRRRLAGAVATAFPPLADLRPTAPEGRARSLKCMSRVREDGPWLSLQADDSLLSTRNDRAAVLLSLVDAGEVWV